MREFVPAIVAAVVGFVVALLIGGLLGVDGTAAMILSGAGVLVPFNAAAWWITR
jgi:tetrahydromethanopterin S-methyltransferase subunit C